MKREIFIVGATGFIGLEVVRQALLAGWDVTALVSSTARATLLPDGVKHVVGRGEAPEAWIAAAAGHRAFVDLVQPALPKRITLAAIQDVSLVRQRVTRAIVAALATIPAATRPLYLSVSGIDDLQPDAGGRVDDRSPLCRDPVGFGHIGLPIRAIVEQSRLASAFVYFGTVYGPGKAFGETILPGITRGTFPLVGGGGNRTPLVHVEDAARAIVHLAGLSTDALLGRSFVVADGSGATAREVFEHAAELLGARRPRPAPKLVAALIAGRIAVETLTRDLLAVPEALHRTGFTFRYPSYREGLPVTIRALGLPARPAPAPRRAIWPLAAVAIGAFVAENTLDFPFSVSWFTRLAGGLPLLDMRLRYTAGEAFALFDALGAAGRHSYLVMLCSLDVVLPLLFGLFLSSVIARGPLARLRALPFAAVALDYLENATIATLLLRYPAPSGSLAAAAPVLTSLKFLAYGTGVLLALVTPLSWVRARGAAPGREERV